MAAINLPEYTAGLPAARVDASLRQAIAACDRARECAVLWFAEVQRRKLHRTLGHASLQLYAAQALGFSDNRCWQFKRLADDLDRLPAPAAVPASITPRADALRLARFASLLEKARKQRRVAPGADRLGIVLAALEELVGATGEQGRKSAAPAQVIVHRCPDCAAATVTTSRGEQPLAPAQVVVQGAAPG